MPCETCGAVTQEELVEASMLAMRDAPKLDQVWIHPQDFAALGGVLSRYPTLRERFVWWVHDRLEAMAERFIRWADWWRA